MRSDCKSRIAYLIRINPSLPQGITPISIPQGITPASSPQGFEDLLITPWHPVKIDGFWQYPAESKGALIEKIECEAVYSFLLFDKKSQVKNCLYNADVKNLNNPFNDIENMNNRNNLNQYNQQNRNSKSNNKNDDNNNNDHNDNNNNNNPYASIMKVNGIECATLAHGIFNEKVISHPFFGTLKVEREMRRCKGWDVGFIHFGAYERTSLLQEHQYDSSFLAISDSRFISTSSENPNHTNYLYDSSHDIDNIISIKSTEQLKEQSVTTSVSVSMSMSVSESCLIRDVNTGLANGFLLSMEL